MCHEVFYRNRNHGKERWENRKCCSHKCSARSRKVLGDRQCAFCSATFTLERKDRKYCNSACAGAAKTVQSKTQARYKKITTPDGRRMLEHRYVMERKLGRALHPWENVHHKNDQKKDNVEMNLELWIKPQPNGARLTDFVDFIVRNYPEETRESARRLGIE